MALPSLGRWLRCLPLLALAVALGCELNPQPEVPGGGLGGTGGVGGSYAGSGGSGALGTGAGGSGGGSGGGIAATPCGGECESGELCATGKCVDDPCEPNACDASEACKPTADFAAAGCFSSCANVTCGDGETCVDGDCQPTGCATACAPGEACSASGDGGFACMNDPCSSQSTSCAPGDVCDPVSGTCIADPCTGVKCPTGQACVLGQCLAATDAGTD
ncbi:MAG: hypothetical protein KF718_20290 [Polyangiaceae bacterium]|nr:hypothetical protein [Polyangiaceae bacterium]